MWNYENVKQEVDREAKREAARKREAAELDGFVKVESRILSALPAEFRDLVSAVAWEEGHANGYQEVLNYVADLTERL